ADMDLLEAELQEHVEHPPLLVGPHRLDERLITVAQIDRAPSRRPADRARRPLPLGQVDRRKRSVFVDRHNGHKELLGSEPPGRRFVATITAAGPASYPLPPALNRPPQPQNKPPAPKRPTDTPRAIRKPPKTRKFPPA